MDSKWIVVVDDDPSILAALNSMLTMYGYNVVTLSEDGPELVDYIEKIKPSLIILDVMLSGEDGRTICRNLKEDIKTSNIPVVMISAHPDVKETSLAAGAVMFLPKPFDMNELITIVQTYS